MHTIAIIEYGETLSCRLLNGCPSTCQIMFDNIFSFIVFSKRTRSNTYKLLRSAISMWCLPTIKLYVNQGYELGGRYANIILSIVNIELS